ncbi:carbohydrate esterase family 4 protein [Atractiella rhizophila]|nr:carbohydrate esterase family 4 protein [Atractiella rhizophila]
MEYPATDPDCWWSRGGCVTPKQSYLSPDHHHCTQKGTWGLTFDDGPTCASATLYGILEKEKLKASLYFIGGNVLQFPGQAQAAVEAGHEICGHTWSHQMTTTLSNEEVFAEMYYTTKAIKAITGIQTKCFRPSYGDVDDRVRTIGHALGLRIDLWSDDTFDWELTIKGKKVIDANYAAIFAKASAAEGVTVLTHETSNVTVGQFQNRFPLAKKAFNVFAPVGTCLGIQQYYVQDNLTFPTYEQYVSGSIEPSTQWRSFLSEGTLDIPLQAVSDAAETKSSASETW